MNCPSCGAPMHLTAGQASLVCEYCKGIYFPAADDDGVRILDETQNQLCPICGIPLMNATLDSIGICACQKCRGMLLGMGQFMTLIEEPCLAKSGSGSDSAELTRKIYCPQCHKPMETHFYYGGGHVVIDDCNECSLIWLDHGKLERLASAARESEPHYNE